MGFLGNGTLFVWWTNGSYYLWICYAFLPSQWVHPLNSVLLTSRIVEVVYSTIGALIFSLYIIYDTHNICNVLHPDEYIIGSINLYVILCSWLILVTLISSIYS